MPPLATLQTDAFETTRVGQFADRHLKYPGCFVEYQCFNLRGNSAARQWKCGSTTPKGNGKMRPCRRALLNISTASLTLNARWETTSITPAIWTCWKRARGEFFRQQSQTLRQWQESGTAFPVISARIDYKGPARYDDVIALELWITEMRGVRLSFGFRITQADGSLLAEGETRHVCATIEEKPQRLPKELIERFQPFVRLPSAAA